MITTDYDNRENINDLSELNEKPLIIKTTLVKTDIPRKIGNTLIEDFNYDIIGSNGLLEASPNMVKISGFELNKKHKVKLLIINKSKFSQRLNIIPPTTPFFKIQFTKKGNIPPGLSETVIITFSPNSYQYYYDYIRIHCEGDKMQIPIHAFPKMNIHMKDYVPKYINFGNVSINSGEHKEIVLRNIITSSFEYEIIPIKKNDAINVEPLVGEIESFSNKVILFTFKPTAYGLYIAEYEFRLSEFDYQPVIINISGTCNVYDKVKGDNMIKHMKQFKEKPAETEPIAREKLVINQTISQNPNTTSKSETKESGLAKKFKNFPSNKEKEFLNYYNDIDKLIKDKDIKYIRFIGKQTLTDDELKDILNNREKNLNQSLMIKRRTDVNRFQIEFDDICSVNRSQEYYLKPTFNVNQNDKFFKTRHYYNLFLKSVTKQLIRARADKRLTKIQNMIKNNNIKTSDDFEEYMKKDWNNYLNKESNSEEFSYKIRFIKPKEIIRTQIYNSNDYNINSLKQEIPHETNINMEELSPFTPLDRNEIEALFYKEMKSNGITLYEITTDDKVMRTCAENENIIRGQRGDSELDFVKINNILEMPDSYKRHADIGIDAILFSNPSFKKFAPYNYYTEGSIDFNLQPRKLDNTVNNIYDFKHDLYKKLPLSLNLNNREVDSNYIKFDSYFDKIPERLSEKDQRDLFIKKDEKIDDDNYIFDIKKNDYNKLLDEIEKDDEAMKKIREINKNDVFDHRKEEKAKSELKLQSIKQKWIATIPTLIENYNSNISNPKNRFIL